MVHWFPRRCCLLSSSIGLPVATPRAQSDGPSSIEMKEQFPNESWQTDSACDLDSRYFQLSMMLGA